jgi:hypothetical protein
MQDDERRKGKFEFEVVSKKRAHDIFAGMIVSNYKKCIEELIS